MGAFNARSPEWWKNDHTAAEGPQVESLTSSYVLIQVISQPTPILPTSNSCIDLIFTNQLNLVIESDVHTSLRPNSYHQLCSQNSTIEYPPIYKSLIRNYKNPNVNRTNTVTGINHLKGKIFKIRSVFSIKQ